jgi:sugar lactone lactonase YvrE
MTQVRSQAPLTEAEKPPVTRSATAKRFLVIIGVLIGALLITGFTGYLILNAINGTRHEAAAVATGVTVAAYATVPGDAAYPIGIARAPDGTVYLTTFGTGAIYKAALDGSGTLTPWVQVKPNTSGNINGITAPAGLTVAPDGTVYVIDFNSSKPGTAVGTLKQISPDGKVTAFANGSSNPQINGGLSFLSHLAFDGQGNLYVTFTATGEVWRYLPSGQGAVWLKLVTLGSSSSGSSTAAQPTGIVYDKVQNAMIVADAISGTVYRAAINTDGSAAQPLVLYRQAGLAVQSVSYDDNGHLLLTAWLHDNGQLARLESDGTYTLLAQSFREPSDALAVGHKVYVVNSDLLGLTPLLHPNLPFTVDVVTLP